MKKTKKETEKAAFMIRPYVVKKDSDGKYSVTISAAFRADVLGAADKVASATSAIARTQEEVKAVGLNLWTALTKAKKDGCPSNLTFFRAFDPTIPEKSGKPGSKERAACMAHKRLCALEYLAYKVGKAAATKPMSVAEKAAEAASRAEERKDTDIALAKFIRDARLSQPQVAAMFRLFGWTSKAKDDASGRPALNSRALAIYNGLKKSKAA